MRLELTGRHVEITPALRILVTEKLATLEAQHAQLGGERDAILGRRSAWRAWRARLGDLQAWCRTVAANVDDLDYDGRRLAMEALGVRVTLWGTDHTPRYEILTNLDPAIVCPSPR